MLLVWFFLQGFIAVVGPRGVSSNTGSSNDDCNFGCKIKQTLEAALVIIIFQLARTILVNVLIIINSKLPEFLEQSYFAQFAIQMQFFFYYRNLFISYSGILFFIFYYLFIYLFIIYYLFK